MKPLQPIPDSENLNIRIDAQLLREFRAVLIRLDRNGKKFTQRQVVERGIRIFLEETKK